MKAVTRHARHLSLARAEQAAGQAFGFAEEGVAAAALGFGRVTMTATGAAVAAAFAATLAWAF
ncbi:hypothetical protein DA075_21490 [Methylobacterium currus]|jgi:hypothetical protein|uniref:Uncharacterized protein n=1 Tax=Methylobacterium currus TaxID=2051553 RepID=A0A2R4WNR7_9HYPH|nr:hypothetical protein [Methylobacterium currus]AWB23158.1 hypothetical protein DA075_21490 [Methylobacterium currus]UHC17201.1 hypothetical protein LRS73_04670 [Methylobacterium currus]